MFASKAACVARPTRAVAMAMRPLVTTSTRASSFGGTRKGYGGWEGGKQFIWDGKTHTRMQWIEKSLKSLTPMVFFPSYWAQRERDGTFPGDRPQWMQKMTPEQVNDMRREMAESIMFEKDGTSKPYSIIKEPRERLAMTFVGVNGERLTVDDAYVGESLWHVMIRHKIVENWYTACQSVMGERVPSEEFGQGPACAICAVYVPPGTGRKMNEIEEQLLTIWLSDPSGKLSDSLRLGCQITLTSEMNGLVIGVPDLSNSLTSGAN